MRLFVINKFLQQESTSSVVLFIAAFLSMIWVNSPLASLHSQFMDMFLIWINEGLMTLFFLVIGLELKHGFFGGHLAKPSQLFLSFIAALGGMIVPALIYCYFNYGHPETFHGWATPVATDIAFALGALTLFGKRVPPQLKLFLMALAIFDDIGAILIITFFYSGNLSTIVLFEASVLMLMLFAFNRLKINSLVPYLLVGAWLWLCLLPSGIHTTLAGVLLAMMIPIKVKDSTSPLLTLKNALNPWVAYFIMPVFALANAGFPLHDLTLDMTHDVVILGTVLGLFLGKQIGVFVPTWLLVKMGFVKLPKKTPWLAIYGVALLCGIGFTMSLFLGTLSFQNEPIYLSEVRVGVMVGSLLSGIFGVSILKIVFARDRS